MIFLHAGLEISAANVHSSLVKPSTLWVENEIEKLGTVDQQLARSTRELKLFVVAKIIWPARTRELPRTMVLWSVKYTRSRAKYWTLWDRNLKQGSFTGKILWKPTEVCLLWYSHATKRTCGGKGVWSGHPKLHIFRCSVTDSKYFLPEGVFCSQIRYNTTRLNPETNSG